ncbi:MAG: hypothetical protein WBY94_13905 [Polyangiaceae bacterium]
MKPRGGLVTAALLVVALVTTTARQGSADPSVAQGQPPKRPLPDYGGRPKPKTVRDLALWVPRLILSPFYLVFEYVIREPLAVALPAAEGVELPRKVRDFFIFGPQHKSGIVPVGYIDFGFNPSVGVYGFWNDAFARGNDWSLHSEVWPPDWYALSLKESARLGPHEVVRFQAMGLHRPDQVFYGIGPRTLQSSQSRFSESIADESATIDVKNPRGTSLQLTVGVRSELLGPGHYGKDPSLEREAASGAFPVPYGFGSRYTAVYNRVVASFDSRQPAPAPGSGIRVDAKAEQGGDMLGSPASGWIRYGAAAAGFVDLDRHQHVVSLSVMTTFADPLGDRPIPFTELVALGGEEPMPGYFPRRLLDRSAAVAALHYGWPLAPYLGAEIEAALGNVFDEHLQGFRLELLRFSGDVGITTIGVQENPIAVIVGIGSETFEHGGQVDSVRVRLSMSNGF